MKKILAPGCETPIIAKLMAAARPFAYGMCMAGAGGGGFLYVLTKDKNQKHLLLDILGTVEVIIQPSSPTNKVLGDSIGLTHPVYWCNHF